MHTIDDDLLSTWLHEAALGIDPRGGAESILVAAVSDDTTSSTRRRWMPALGAAAAVLAIAVPLTFASARVPTSSSALHSTASGLPGVVFGTSGQATGSRVAEGLKVSTAHVQQSGSATITVASGAVPGAVAHVGALASANGGFIASRDVTSTNGVERATITLSVPVTRFESTVRDLSKIGTVSNLVTSALDRTSDYVDLSAQLTAARASEQQYLAIMRRATTVAEVLQVQSQLDQIQTTIDQLTAQINSLNSVTANSSLTVSIYQSGHQPNHASESGLIVAMKGAVSGFVKGVEVLIRLIGPVLFATLLVGGIWLIVRTLRRRAF